MSEHPTCSHGGARQLAAAQDKYVKAIDLKRRGKSYREIAKALGYADESGAYKAVQQGLKLTLQQPADALRAEEMDRLDKLQDMMWDRLQSEDDNVAIKASDHILRIMARRAKLTGLDYSEAEFVPIEEMRTFLMALRDIVQRYVPEDQHRALWAEMRSVAPKPGK